MIPELDNIYKFYKSDPSQPGSKFTTLGDVLSGVLNIIFYAAMFIAFYFLVWAAISYVLAQGKKEDLAKARARITWTLVGLMIVFMAYLIAGYISTGVLQPGKGWIPF